MHGRISPRRACNPCGYTMKMSSRYHRLLIYNVKLTTKIDGIGPFKNTGDECFCANAVASERLTLCCQNYDSKSICFNA